MVRVLIAYSGLLTHCAPWPCSAAVRSRFDSRRARMPRGEGPRHAVVRIARSLLRNHPAPLDVTAGRSCWSCWSGLLYAVSPP